MLLSSGHFFSAGAQSPLQATEPHVWCTQGEALPQWPVELQVWTPLPEHSLSPGEQEPVQAPAWHAWLEHSAGVPQVPVVEQVSTALPVQSV